MNTNVANVLWVRVQRDADFISEMIKKLNDYFFTILLPEIVSRRNDVSQHTEKLLHMQQAMLWANDCLW